MRRNSVLKLMHVSADIDSVNSIVLMLLQVYKYLPIAGSAWSPFRSFDQLFSPAVYINKFVKVRTAIA